MGKVAQLKPGGRYDVGQPNEYRPDPPRTQHPDRDVSTAYPRMLDWARDLADNSSIAQSVLEARETNAIGEGLTYEPMVKDRRGELIEPINDELRYIHEEWSQNPEITGEYCRQELELALWRAYDVDGECFVRRVMGTRAADGFAGQLGYQLEVLDSDWIPMWLSGIYDGNNIVNGIQKNQWGRATRYYIAEPLYGYNLWPFGSPGMTPATMQNVPAADMFHFKRAHRAKQTRGITLFSALAFRIEDISEFQNSHRLAARASADLVFAIERDAIYDAAGTAEQTEPDKVQLAAVTIMDNLAPGEKVNNLTPSHPNQDAIGFVNQELTMIATGAGVGKSQIAQIFDRSYSAQRMEMVDVYRRTSKERAKFIKRVAKPALWDQVVEAAIRAGRLPARALRRADPRTITDARIYGPTLPLIDPTKERQAFEMDQTNGWDSKRSIIRKLGRRPSDVEAEIASEPQPQETQNDDQLQDQRPQEEG